LVESDLLSDVVDVEARVDQENSLVYSVEHVACVGVGLIGIGEEREGLLRRRESEVLLQV